MAGIFGQQVGHHRRAVHRDIEAMELEAAKEILAEVFRIDLEEVEDMIYSRLQEVHPEVRQEGLWPQEFWVESQG